MERSLNRDNTKYERFLYECLWDTNTFIKLQAFKLFEGLRSHKAFIAPLDYVVLKILNNIYL
jgi:hypothetical protein